MVITDKIRACSLAEKLSTEMNLPPGNLWICGATRGILFHLNQGYTLDAIEKDRRWKWGLRHG